MRRIREVLKRPSSRQYQDLLLRLNNVETTIDTLLNSPVHEDKMEVGFNGQCFRKEIFFELLRAFDCQAIIETGTWIGNTTGFMAKNSRLPVYTCELNARFHALAKMRLAGVENIHFDLCNSIELLTKHSKGPLSQERTFIYLDAHWYEGLPLEEEIKIIAENWKEFVIMIDDFEVPGDSGYGYDNFYESQQLDMKSFSSIFDRFDLIPFFPSVPSEQETGSKRGCVVLTKKGSGSEKLSTLPHLRKAKP